MGVVTEKNLRAPVLVTLGDGSTASGFFVETTDHVFFVTAKHVLYNEDSTTHALSLRSNTATLLRQTVEAGAAPIEQAMDLATLQQQKLLIPHKEKDIALAYVGPIGRSPEGRGFYGEIAAYKRLSGDISSTTLTVSIASLKKYQDVAIGNDVYLFGYPTSIGVRNLPQIDYKTPLLRKGIVAGKNDAQRSIILDCPVYYGNSGGPVAELDMAQRKFLIIGVVSQFVPFAEEWVSLSHGHRNMFIENSGYSVVTPVDFALELIEGFTPPIFGTEIKTATSAAPIPAA